MVEIRLHYSDPMSRKFLLFSLPSKTLDLYRKTLDQFKVEHDWVTSLHDIRQQLAQDSYHGLLLDLRSRIKANENDRDFCQELESYFPTTNLQFDARNQSIRCASPVWMNKTFEDFIQTNLEHPARRIRAEVRKTICLNALVMIDRQERRANTVDISSSGCFIWDTMEADPKKEIQLVFPNMSNKPIDGEVIWCRKWGQEQLPSGYSVKFSRPQPELIKGLAEKS